MTFVLTAFLLGLMGSMHCLGMCGGIAGALSMASRNESVYTRLTITILYNFGRLLSYSIAGASMAVLGHWLIQDLGLTWLRSLAAIILMLAGLYIAGWWRGLVYLERGGARIWKFIQPISGKLLPVTKSHQALLLGLLWGWLPCGLVYSALVLAATQADLMKSILVMFSFGLGTLPSMLVGGFAAGKLKRFTYKAWVRNLTGISLIALGSAAFAMPFLHRGHHTGQHDMTEIHNHHH
ncbi:MAG: sulfite exporter TauE/SafE family protein [Exilibacterium sp.]